MPGLGFPELVIIFLLALLLFGPKELPKLARFLVKLINEMKQIFNRLKSEWNLSDKE